MSIYCHWHFPYGDVMTSTTRLLWDYHIQGNILLSFSVKMNHRHWKDTAYRYVRGQMTSRCTHVACAQFVCSSSGRWLGIVWRISGFGRGCNQICPHPPSSLPPSTYSSFPLDSSCVTLDPLCPTRTPSSESSWYLYICTDMHYTLAWGGMHCNNK